MATKDLGLPTDARSLVFREIVNRLRTNPLLDRVVGKENWFVWDGSRDDEAEFGSGGGIQIRLTPRVGPGAWQDETGQQFPLLVDIEALINGTDADDFLALQMAIEIALYQPSDHDASLSWQVRLMGLGAVDGLISFVPLNDVDAAARKDGTWGLRGQLSIDVRRTFNP